jgi:C-terminal processing protease CtpA/Prc
MMNKSYTRHRRSSSGGSFTWLATLFLLLPLAACAEAQENSKRVEAFDQIWEQINSNFYDETFGGRDWQAIGEEYREKALKAPTEKDFYVTLNTMLFRLEVSHIGVIPNDHPEWIGAPSSFPDGEVGLNIRIIENRIVVTHRKAELGDTAPAIQPGTVLTSLNGLTLDDFMAEVTTPPVPAIPPLILATERAGRELFRDAGETVEITYLNEEGTEESATLTAFPRDGAIQLMEGIPPVYLDFESRAIGEQIGYIRFSSFHGELTERILAAITEYHDFSGLIIDLRGNVGGDFRVRRAIAEHLITEHSLVWRYVNRFGAEDIILEPAPNGYRGKVVFLVDEMSASSAEELPGALQALGRAKVIGNKTAGLVLVAGVLPLEIGATLVYPSAETRFMNGYVPEGKGITPDVNVPYDIASLRAGKDPQLETAIRILQE